MKKLTSFAMVLACVLGLVGCGTQNDSGKIMLPKNIEKITIAWNDGPLTTFSYTDSEKIDRLAEYITSLELSSTEKDPTQYNGGGWAITVTAKSDTIEMYHYGNSFFKTGDGTWWEMGYEQAAAFEPLLKESTPDELPQNSVFDEWTE